MFIATYIYLRVFRRFGISFANISQYLCNRYYDHRKRGNKNPTMKLEAKEKAIVWSYAVQLLGQASVPMGIASHACEIFERYFNAIGLESSYLTTEAWALRLKDVKSRSGLILSVSLQLSSKMISATNFLSTKEIQAYILRRCGKFYSVKQINQCEHEVFEAIGFIIPLWTNVQLACKLAQDLGFNQAVVLDAGVIMDTVDFNQQCLVRAVRYSMKQSHLKVSANALLGGVVIAAAYKRRTKYDFGKIIAIVDEDGTLMEYVTEAILNHLDLIIYDQAHK